VGALPAGVKRLADLVYNANWQAVLARVTSTWWSESLLNVWGREWADAPWLG